MNDQTKPASRRWRRYLRFSVRGLIVLVLVIGGWLGWLVRSARIQREAVAAITKTGGSVNYNWEWREGAPIPSAQPAAPRWLVDLVGVDYFGHVTRVSYIQGLLNRQSAKIAEMNARLSALQSKMNDAFESADGKPVTQAQREKLSESAMEDGKTFAAKLEELEQLSQRDVRFTDDDVAHLEWFTDLSELDLTSTSVTDAGLAHIEGLSKLERLDLHSTRITDAGLSRLKGLANLRSLNISFSSVTNAGLANLKGLSKLTFLEVGGTQVTDAGVKELQQAMPKLNVIRYPP